MNLTKSEQKMLDTIKAVVDSGEDQGSVSINPANQGLIIKAAGDRTRQTIGRLIKGGFIVPNPNQPNTSDAGFDDNQAVWHGFPVDAVMTEEEAQEMAEKTEETKQEKKARKPAKSRATSLEGVKAEDFFHENARKKVVFRPGWDAKLAAMFKRIINGTATADDKRLLKAKTLVEHEKVNESAHLAPLRDEARNAA